MRSYSPGSYDAQGATRRSAGFRSLACAFRPLGYRGSAELTGHFVGEGTGFICAATLHEEPFESSSREMESLVVFRSALDDRIELLDSSSCDHVDDAQVRHHRGVDGSEQALEESTFTSDTGSSTVAPSVPVAERGARAAPATVHAAPTSASYGEPAARSAAPSLGATLGQPGPGDHMHGGIRMGLTDRLHRHFRHLVSPAVLSTQSQPFRRPRILELDDNLTGLRVLRL